MRPEKTLLIKETSDHLEKSQYFFLADYHGINSEETGQLRSTLSGRGAEFHVVKNSSLAFVAKEKNLPDLSEYLSGHTAIVVGGDDASGVAKDIGKFNKTANKFSIKCGALGDRLIGPEEVKKLANLPSIEICRAQLLGLLNQPASTLLSTMNQPARGFLTVLQAKSNSSNS